MNKIVERINEIVRMLQEDFPQHYTGDIGTINRCYDPIVYMQTANPTKFPLILVYYEGSVYTNTKQYPCTSSFKIYFVDVKKKADELLDLMQEVYYFFNNKPVKSITENNVVVQQKMIYQEQSFHAESSEHVIYVQKYNLLIT